MKKTFITPFLTKQCLFFLFFLSLPFAGCGPTLQAGSPVIRDFAFLEQKATDPRIFCFTLEWQDEEGDLATSKAIGQIRIKVQDLSKPNTEPQAISPIKITSQVVAEGTTSGTFSDLCIKLEEATGAWPERIKIFAQLLDSLGNPSNQAWVLIKIKK